MSSLLNTNAVWGTSPVAEQANTSLAKHCTLWLAKERNWITDRHVELCRIPALTFLEEKRAAWMLAQFRAMGYEAKIDRGGNVVAFADAHYSGPYVALTAHLDTVLAPRSPDDIRVDADGTLRGPGVSDNGSGLAALLALARAFESFSTQGRPEILSPLIFVANVGEEGEGNLSGMRYLCRQSSLASKIRAFVVLDGPTTSHITHQALASRRFEVSYNGAGGHSWSDFGAANPVHALSRAVTLFLNQAQTKVDGARTSYNFGLIEGGSSINSIATQARAKLDLRSEDSLRIQELVDLLMHCIEQSLQQENEPATGGKVTAKIKEIGSRPGGALQPHSEILQHIRAVDSFLGNRSYLDCSSTDANIPLSMGIEAISIGTGGQGGAAHTPAEWFHPENREQGLRRILLVLLLLLDRQ